MPAISRRSRLVTDLVSSTALSRRNFLGSLALLALPGLAWAQESRKRAAGHVQPEGGLYHHRAGRRLHLSFQLPEDHPSAIDRLDKQRLAC